MLYATFFYTGLARNPPVRVGRAQREAIAVGGAGHLIFILKRRASGSTCVGVEERATRAQ